MDNKELMVFLRTTLVKIENAINLLTQDLPKHILAYHKALGIQQKFRGLSNEHKNQMLPQIIIARSIINYLVNGRYKVALDQILKLRKELIHIYSQLENERDTD